MKKLNLTIKIAVILAIGVLYYLHYSATPKLAYIDTNVLLSKYEGMKAAKKEYEKKAAVWQANSDTLLAGWQNELKAYEKERSSMSAKEKELKEQLLQNKQQQISGYQEAMQKKAQEEEQKITQTALNEVNDYIKEYGEKHGYSFILGANSTGNIVYANNKQNLTDIIVKGLNEEYKK